jgi:hypothetical protein
MAELQDVLKVAKRLSWSDKAELLQVIRADLDEHERLMALVPAGSVWEVWTPFGCHEAEAAMKRVLDERPAMP